MTNGPTYGARDADEPSSFPYLRFARLHGLDYPDVLRAAEYLSDPGRIVLENCPALWDIYAKSLERLPSRLVDALCHVVAHEYDRRKAVESGDQ